MAVDLDGLFADLRAETEDLLALVHSQGPLDEVMAAATPAVGWTVGDTLGHLWFFDREARRAAEVPEEFSAALPELIADADGYMTRALSAAAKLGPRVVPTWRDEREAMIQALSRVPAGTRIPWYGPPMSPASSATARLMETWAHGQDVADALGVRRQPTDRLRHICHLGVRTREFSYIVRGLPPPTGDVFVSLTPPGGGPEWTFGSPAATDRIAGPALDFCLLVTQRRTLADLSLRVEGAAAQEWAAIAQAFAGADTLTDPSRAGLQT